MYRTLLLAFGLLGSIGSSVPLSAQEAGGAPAPGPAIAQGTSFGSFGFAVDGMDRTLAPGDDFMGYACGNALKKMVIPVDRSSYNALEKLTDLSLERCRVQLEACKTGLGAGSGPEAKKLYEYYSTFMDEPTLEAKGLAPLQPHLEAIAGIETRAQLAAVMGLATRMGVPVPVVLYCAKRDPYHYALHVSQGGLGLPDRAYYLDTNNPVFAALRTGYVTHIRKLLSMAGLDHPSARAERIFALEVKLAEGHRSPAQRRQDQSKWERVADLESKPDTPTPGEIIRVSTCAPGMPWGTPCAPRNSIFRAGWTAWASPWTGRNGPFRP